MIKIIKFIIISGLFLVSGCSYSDSVNDIKDAKEWFYKNKNTVLHINDTLLKDATNIRRLEGGIHCTSRFFSVPDSKKYYKLLEKIEKIGLKHVVVAKNRGSGKLIAVDYTLVAEGYVFSHGKSLTVTYIPDETYIENVKKNGYKDEFYPLDEKDWYVIYNPGD